MRVKGKIGVYGRSIGGIAATHLVQKFPNIISCFIGDRTMGDFDQVVLNRFSRSHALLKLYRYISNMWYIDNSFSLVNNSSKCYKILMFDDQDEVIDVWSALHHQVAARYSKINYQSRDWTQFYRSLVTLFQLEG